MISDEVKRSVLENLLKEAEILGLLDNDDSFDSKIDYLMGKGKKKDLWNICKNYNDPNLIEKIKSIIDPS